MHRSRVVVLLTGLFFFHSFAQDQSGSPPVSEAERAARRAQFMQLMQGRAAEGGGNPADQAVATQSTAEGGLLETTRQATPGASEVAVNWENVTLKDCIEVLCRDLGMEFVISPSVNVSQEVSVRAGDVTRWEKGDKQELFDAILETAGVQRVQRGRVWVFSPSDIRPVVESFKDGKYGDGKPVIGVLKLRNVDASQAEQFLNTVGGKPPRVFAMKGTRMILVLGTQQFLTQMEELVKLIDFPPGILIPYTLEFASSDDMTRELTAVFQGRTGGNGDPIRFISVARLNTVVALNVPEGLADEVTKWIRLLDRADEANERVTRVYRLQVINSETVVKTLDSLYSSLYRQTQTRTRQQAQATSAARRSSSAEAAPAARAPAGNAGAAAAPAAKTESSAPRPSGQAAQSPSMEEEAVILADKDTNTLIINATPDQHRDIERTIRELDRPRRQVLIETVLVEVTLDESLDFGVEWAVSKGLSLDGSVSLSKNMSGNVANGVIGNNDGFSYLLKSSSDKLAFIRAAENNNRLQVLSSPTVLTRDGMEAQVSFGDEVPIQEKSTSDRQNNFSYTYRDAKITLTVTPVIDDNKMVTLNLNQTLRQIDPDYTPIATGDNVIPPIFTTREIRSNLQVDSGQTLVLGGLIQRKDQQLKTGIPLLCRAPLIGWLFGSTKTVKVGSEILMILTPHVVDTRDETDLLTRDFRDKILGAMSEKDVRNLYPLTTRAASEAEGQ